MEPRKSAEEVETRTRALFEESVERLDARTRSRLTHARHAALDELERARAATRSIRALWAPAAGLAATAAAVALLFGGAGGNGAMPGQPLLEEPEVIAAAENVALLEDVEFYAWLAEQAETPGEDRG